MSLETYFDTIIKDIADGKSTHLRQLMKSKEQLPKSSPSLLQNYFFFLCSCTSTPAVYRKIWGSSLSYPQTNRSMKVCPHFPG